MKKNAYQRERNLPVYSSDTANKPKTVIRPLKVYF